MTTADFPIRRNWKPWVHEGSRRDMFVNAVARSILADNPDQGIIKLCDDFVARCDAIYDENGEPMDNIKILALARDVDTSKMHELPEGE